jgi:FtsH-binding integral membrane protein
MLVLRREQRILLAETIREMANIAAGAMVFGHFLGGQTFSWTIAGGGLVVWSVLLAWSVVLVKDGNQ